MLIHLGRFGVPFFLLVSGWFSYAPSTARMMEKARKKLGDTLTLLGIFCGAYLIMNSLTSYLSGAGCFSWILDYANEIQNSAKLDQIRWNQSDNDLLKEVEIIREYLSERVNFLSSVWIHEKDYVCVRAVQQWGGYYAYYAVARGETLTELPRFEDKENALFVGWYYCDTNEPFDINKPITEDVQIYAKWEDAPTKKMEQVLQLLPLAVIGLIGVGLLISDVRKSRKS